MKKVPFPSPFLIDRLITFNRFFLRKKNQGEKKLAGRLLVAFCSIFFFYNFIGSFTPCYFLALPFSLFVVSFIFNVPCDLNAGKIYSVYRYQFISFAFFQFSVFDYQLFFLFAKSIHRSLDFPPGKMLVHYQIILIGTVLRYQCLVITEFFDCILVYLFPFSGV